MTTVPPASSAPSIPSLTYNQTVRGITEFIEVAIHTILYVRQVYPAELFIRRKKYDTPVFQSRHPALNAYISGAVKALGEELVNGNLDKVVIVIKNKEEKALERFMFSVENMIQVEKFDKDISVERSSVPYHTYPFSSIMVSVEGAMSSLALGQYFRSFLVKLSMIEAQLGQRYLGDDVSFAILMELKDDMKPSLPVGSKEPPPWIPADQQHTTSGASEDAELHVVRAVSTGIINLSLVVQESDVKLGLDSDTERSRLEKGKTRVP